MKTLALAIPSVLHLYQTRTEMKRNRDIVTIDFTGEPGLKKHIVSASRKKKYSYLSKYIKDVLRVHTEYKEEVKEIKV